MELITVADDGTTVIRMTADEARGLRDDLGNMPHNQVSPGGDKLHSLLEISHGPTRPSDNPAQAGLSGAREGFAVTCQECGLGEARCSTCGADMH